MDEGGWPWDDGMEWRLRESGDRGKVVRGRAVRGVSRGGKRMRWGGVKEGVCQGGNR